MWFSMTATFSETYQAENFSASMNGVRPRQNQNADVPVSQLLTQPRRFLSAPSRMKRWSYAAESASFSRKADSARKEYE